MLRKLELANVGLLTLSVLSIALLITPRPAQAQTETVLYNFTGSPDGAVPESPLISDAAGNFYGTTLYGGEKNLGAVYEISPNGEEGWNETVIHSFDGKDGEYPESSPLIFDTAGILYGITSYGGSSGCGYGCGLVYELSPQGKRWKQTVLYSFTGGVDGGGPVGGLIMDGAGNLYGTLAEPAGVFELSPSGGGWTEQLIYAADTISGGVAMDELGNIFGTTSSTVFELSPNGNGGWNSSVLHTFAGGPHDGSAPVGTLAIQGYGRNQSLFGATYAGGAKNFGTVYELSNGKGKYKGTWVERIIHSFKGFPNDGSGPANSVGYSFNLYGTTLNGGEYGYGTVFWIEAIEAIGEGPRYYEWPLLNFNGAGGSSPCDSLILESDENLYGTASTGGSSGAGVVFKVPSPLVQ
jgi:uncharacterized repeat protein (TIGR03803 family)